MSAILIGDIGGTKTTLAFYKLLGNSAECIHQNTYRSIDFDQFNELLNQFVNDCGHQLPDSKPIEFEALCLSVAGPIIEQQCQTTNLPWHINAKDLQQSFCTPHVHLLNDIEATGLGLLHSDANTLTQINPNAKFADGNRAIISVGTGLGEAFLFQHKGEFIPCPSEGGHEDFAPLEEPDLALWRYLKQRFPSHISYERIVSGPGIAVIYDFLCEHSGKPNLAPSDNKSAWISTQAINKADDICVEVMQMFIRFLAHEAANMALKVFALGGVYLAGGVTAKIASLIQEYNFEEHFINKGRFKHLLQDMPIWINLNEQAPLDGALYKARLLAES